MRRIPAEERWLRGAARSLWRSPRIFAATWCALAAAHILFARDLEASRGLGFFLVVLGSVLGLALAFVWYAGRLLLCMLGPRCRVGWRRFLLMAVAIGLVPWLRQSWLPHWLFFARHRAALEASLRGERSVDLGGGESWGRVWGGEDAVSWQFSVRFDHLYWIVHDPSGAILLDPRSGHLESDWYWTWH